MTSVYEEKDSGGVTCHDELDFAELFEYDPPCFPGDQDESVLSSHVLSSPSSVPYPFDEVVPYDIKSCSSSYQDPPQDSLESRGYLDHTRQGGPALSPRIEITPSRELYNHARDSLQAHPVNISPRPTLTVPGHDGLAYREPQCLSPASSNSSTSWHSENYSPWASPCVSPSSGQAAGDLCPRFQNFNTGSPRASPGTSPRTSVSEEGGLGARSPSPRPGSRSVSPQGKRTYDMYRNPGLVPGHRSRSPSPHGPHEEPRAPQYGHSPSLVDTLNGFGAGLPGSIPTKIVKTGNAPYSLYRENLPDSCVPPADSDGKDQQGAESFFVIPPIWPKQLVPSYSSIPVSSLPPLEWPVPSCTDQYELHIEVQPKQHHRAHYETEGSRGAVKALNGGHPVVQLRGYRGKDPLGLQIFIGTADERILKPHAFYQVHRITGKTVTTTSFEKLINSTKVLEIPLEPKNNMKAVIDCAGILKLRNADIELRKGETDIGRKNTRVRLVFRVHIPQPGGHHVSLQVASHPIECSQRSAHELPMVETQDVDRCSVLGGQQMILTGQNFMADSKVVFTEKTHDGQQIWEMEATVDKDKSQASMLFVEVPQYRDHSICHAAKVNFYVINGKRKRSQPQHFTYTPLAVPSIKTEPVDEYESNQHSYTVPQILGIPPQPYYSSPRGLFQSDTSCLVSCQQGRTSLTAPDSRFQQQSPAIIYPRGTKPLSSSPVLFQQPPSGGVPDPHRSVLVHAGSPAQPTAAGVQPHSTSPSQHPSIIQFSPTNHLVRGAAPPPAQPQHVMYCDGYVPEASAHSPAPPPAVHPQHYPTVIQQQPYVQKMAKNRASPCEIEPQGCPAPEEPRRVTIKQENLDQAYLDDVNEIIRKDLTGVHGRGQT
ncbi:nuclear factor of activated T-cells, cytoplasmic 2 isoform X1 [Arapaima gigas]